MADHTPSAATVYCNGFPVTAGRDRGGWFCPHCLTHLSDPPGDHVAACTCGEGDAERYPDATDRVVVPSAADCPTHGVSAAQGQRDPFANDVLERLIRSNQDYQREHGHYIVPLAERLLAARAEINLLRSKLAEYDKYVGEFTSHA